MSHKEVVEKFDNADYIDENIDLWCVDDSTFEIMSKIPESPDYEYQIFKETLLFKLSEYLDIEDIEDYPELLKKNIALLEPILSDYEKYEENFLDNSDDNPHGIIDLSITYSIDGDRDQQKYLLYNLVDNEMFKTMISSRIKGLKKKLEYYTRFFLEYKK